MGMSDIVRLEILKSLDQMTESVSQSQYDCVCKDAGVARRFYQGRHW